MLLVVVPRFVVFFLLDFTERRRSKRLICWRLKKPPPKMDSKTSRGNVQCSQLAATIWVSSKAWWWFHSEIRLSYPHSLRILKRRHSVLGCKPLLVKPPTTSLHPLYWRKALPAERMAEVGIKLKDVQWPKSFPSCGSYPRIEGHFDLLTKNT